MLKKSKIFIFFLLGFFSGIIFLILIKKFTHFLINNEINLEINPLEFISLAVNILLAIFITNTLGKKIDSEKNEKQYIIDYIQEFRNEFSNSVQNLIDNDDFDNENAKGKLKYLRQKNLLINKILKNNNFIEESDADSMHLKPKINLIWDSFTNESENKNLRIQQINNKRNEIDEIFFKLIFKINRK
jgi:hypothetical protein